MLHNLYFNPPTANEDGSALAPADICGYEARVDGGDAVSLTNGELLSDGRMRFPIEQLSVPLGTHNIEVRTAAKNGARSVWSVPASVVQVILPNPPLLLTAD